LLSWQTRIVPLVGQDQQLQSLVQWVTTDAGGTPKIRFLTGEGGSGKSRTAAELAQIIYEQHGITAGFLKLEQTVTVPEQLTLFIVDYPEERREFTQTLLKELAAHPNWPVRLLLLSRRPLDQWYDVLNAANVLRLVDQQTFAVAQLGDTGAAYLFHAVLDELAKRYGVATPRLTQNAFQKWSERSPYLHRLPLFIIAASVHAAIDPTNALEFTAQQVVNALVLRERGRLQRISRDVGFHEDAAPRLAALATVRGGFGPTELRRFADPHLEIGTSAPNRVIDDVRRLPWWHDNAWTAPSPDILAAALAYNVFRQRPDMASEWLWAALYELKPETIVDRLSRLLHDIGTVYGAEQQRFVDWLIAMIDRDRMRAWSLRILAYKKLPISLARFGAFVCMKLLETSALTESDRATMLNTLSNALSDSGDRVGALRASQDAVGICRRLAQAHPAAFEPDLTLAMSLNNLSNALSDSGDPAGALRAIEEAVAIRRRLAQAQPAAFEPALAMSLNNLSVRLSGSGDRASALRAIEEAVAIYRQLAQAQPAAFEPDLAMSLNTLSNALSDSGDRAGALRAIEEAMAIRRRLAQAQPAAFEPDLAKSLNNLSNRLSDSGDRARALGAIEEAVAIYRQLAQAQPAAFEPDLAMSLNNLSNRLSDSGDRAGALRAIEEAVAIHRQLAQVQPAAFEPTLAGSLNNLSNRLSDSGDRAGALRAIEEAVAIRRQLAQTHPAAFEPALAGSLNNLSNRLSDSGDRAGALRAIEEAVAIRRQLAQAQPAAFEPDLAMSLSNLSVQLSGSGDRAGALRAIEEAVEIHRQLAQTHPAAFEPALANSLKLREALIAG
jgi:hypothetical protein